MLEAVKAELPGSEFQSFRVAELQSFRVAEGAELRSSGFSLWFEVPALQQIKTRNIAGLNPWLAALSVLS